MAALSRSSCRLAGGGDEPAVVQLADFAAREAKHLGEDLIGVLAEARRGPRAESFAGGDGSRGPGRQIFVATRMGHALEKRISRRNPWVRRQRLLERVVIVPAYAML